MLGNKKSILIAIASAFTISSLWAGTSVYANPEMEENETAKTTYSKEMLDASSNRHSRVESKDVVENRHTLDGYKKVMEDSKLEIWLKDSNASIRIVDKESGYIWGGLTADKMEDMNTVWSSFGNSLVGIDYFDVKGIEKRASVSEEDCIKQYTIKNNTIKYSANFTKIGISFDFEVKLNNGELTISVDDSSIKEEDDFVLANIYLAPFLGSVRGNELDGYMFVPDGPGALIRYNEPATYRSIFDKRVYGKDYGIDQIGEASDIKSATRPNDFLKEDTNVSMPVYGAVHGVEQNAMFAKIDGGAEYASIMATPANDTTPYNWVTNKFVYRQKYLQPTSRNGAGVYLVQKNRDSFTPSVTFSFLNDEEADYIGMANSYKEYLKSTGVLSGKESVDENIPLQLDIIAADMEKGFLSNSEMEVTSVEDIENIVSELNSKGVSNISMVVQGWQKNGVGGYEPSEFKFGKTISKGDIEKLNSLIGENGGKIYYSYNPVSANEEQITLREEGAMTLSQALIRTVRDSKDIWLPSTYFIQPRLISKYLMDTSEKYKDHNMDGMAVVDLGSKLYSEGKTGIRMTREEAKLGIEEAMEKTSENVNNIALYTPNDYLWKYCDEMFGLPMINSQYLFETDTVPFMQIVLKGSKDYYAPYSNLSFYSHTDVLKMIEYGAYPSFLITGIGNSELVYSTSSELYSTKYEDWHENMVSIYNSINEALVKVEGKEIVDREVLSEGVVRVDYEGDISIYVNYTDKAYNDGNITVKATSYKVVEGK